MKSISPVSDLKEFFKDFYNQVHESNEPVFLTEK